MALIVVLENMSNIAPVSDYKYGVYVNETLIEQGNVKGHTRADGWEVLLRKMLDQRGKVKLIDTTECDVTSKSVIRRLKVQQEDEINRLKADIVREDGRLERHCKHGVGHTVGHIRGYLRDQWETVHGCCGKEVDGKVMYCCSDFLRQEVRDGSV
jgi:hypothetical protein